MSELPAALEAFPDWTMGSNPHLGIIGPQAVEIVEILATTYLAQFPTLAFGDLQAPSETLQTIELAQTDVIDGPFRPEGFWAFDRYFRGYDFDCQGVIDAIRRGRPATTQAKRVAIRPRADLPLEQLPLVARHLHEYAKGNGLQEPAFRLPTGRVNYIQLINDESLYTQGWTVLSTIRDHRDIAIYKGDGFEPVIASDVLAKEARFLADEMWETGKYLLRSAVDDLARMDAGERVWDLAFKYAPINEEIEDPFPLRSIITGVAEQIRNLTDHPLQGLDAALSGPLGLPSLYDEPGITLVDTTDVNHVKLSFFLTNAFITTAAQQRAHLQKFTIVHADSLLRFAPAALNRVCEGIEIMLRQGRKFSSNVILVGRDPSILRTEAINRLWGLIGNRMIDTSVARNPFAVDEDDDDAVSPLPDGRPVHGLYHWMDTSRQSPAVVDPRSVFAAVRHTRVSIPWA